MPPAGLGEVALEDRVPFALRREDQLGGFLHAAAVSAMLDRLLHHGHLLKCGPRSWRTKTGLPAEGQP